MSSNVRELNNNVSHYSYIDGRWFFLNIGRTTYDAAKNHCTRKLGGKGKMYEPRSNSLTAKIGKEANLRVNDNAGYYVGIKKVNGKFVYESDGSVVSKSLDWADGYPNENGNCVQTLNGKLFNSPCDSQLHQICEYDTGKLKLW